MSAAGSLRPGPDVVSSKVGDEVVLVDLRTDEILVLNRTAARIWELIAAGRDIGEARASLLAEFDVDGEELDRELCAFVSALRARALLAGESGAAPAGDTSA